MEGLVCPVPLSSLLSAQRMKTNDWSSFTPSLSGAHTNEGSEGSDSPRPGKSSRQLHSSLTGTRPDDSLLHGAPDDCRMLANAERAASPAKLEANPRPPNLEGSRGHLEDPAVPGHTCSPPSGSCENRT